MSMTAIGVGAAQNACLGSDLSPGPLARRRSRVCESGVVGGLSDINWTCLEARRASNARPLKLSLPCLRLHVRRNHTSLFKVASVYGKQCQAHTHGVGRTLGLRSGGGK
jgi:hypothetical protein